MIARNRARGRWVAASLLWLGFTVVASPVATAQPLPQDLLRQIQGRTQAATEDAVPSAPLLEGTVDPETYILGPGDSFRIQASGRTAFDLTPRIDPEGWVSLGEYGSVEVGGLTLEAGRLRIRTHLAQLLRDTHVDVRLREIRRFKVYVAGEVLHPGEFPASAATRASDLVAQAGGLRDSASTRTIRVIHRSRAPEDTLDLAQFRVAGRLENDPFLTDGDRVVVPRRTAVFGLFGAVTHPGFWDLRAGESLGQVLRWIDLLPQADSTHAVLARFRGVGPGGTRDRYDTLAVALDRVLDGSADLKLQDGDRVFIRTVPRYHRSDSAGIEGAVVHPGLYPILVGRDRVRDLIDQAGLLSDALPSRITLVRRVLTDSTSIRPMPAGLNPSFTYDRSELVRIHLDLSPEAARTTLGTGEQLDPLLRNGDRIVVPRSTGSVHVAGEVARPGLYAVVPGWGAGEYLDAAGGTLKGSDRGKTRLLRGPEGTSTLADKAELIEPGDILFVPEKEKTARSTFEIVRDLFGIAGQIATIVLIINQVK